MAETFDKLEERLTRLEVTVAEGFHDTKSQLNQAELRDMALSQKIDVNTESLRGDLQTVLSAVDSLADEFRRTLNTCEKSTPRIARCFVSRSLTMRIA